MYDVFISYSRRDTRIANKVCNALAASGLTYFIDRQGISAGASFTEVLSKAIDESSVFLFLAGKNSYASKFTTAEVFYAFKHKQAGAVLPYLIDDRKMPSELEFLLSTTNWLEMSESPIESDLIPAIRSILNKNTAPEVPPAPKGKPWAIIMLIALAVICLAVDVWLYILSGQRKADALAWADHDRYVALISESDSLSRCSAGFGDNEKLEVIDGRIDNLQLAMALSVKADSIKRANADKGYGELFSEDAMSRCSLIQARLDSIHTNLAGRAQDAFDCYNALGVELLANDAAAYSRSALRIKSDPGLERILQNLSGR